MVASMDKIKAISHSDHLILPLLPSLFSLKRFLFNFGSAKTSFFEGFDFTFGKRVGFATEAADFTDTSAGGGTALKSSFPFTLLAAPFSVLAVAAFNALFLALCLILPPRAAALFALFTPPPSPFNSEGSSGSPCFLDFLPGPFLPVDSFQIFLPISTCKD